MNITEAINERRAVKHYVLSFMIPVGKQSKPAWDRGARLPDEKIVAFDCF
jgi:hypothetical protein